MQKPSFILGLVWKEDILIDSWVSLSTVIIAFSFSQVSCIISLFYSPSSIHKGRQANKIEAAFPFNQYS